MSIATALSWATAMNLLDDDHAASLIWRACVVAAISDSDDDWLPCTTFVKERA